MNHRERIMAWLAGIALAALVLNALVLAPLDARLAEARERVRTASEQLDEAEQTLENDRRAQRRWREIAGNSVTTDPSRAESLLLNAAREWAGESRLELTSLRPERIEAEERGYRRITVRLSGNGDMEHVARFLWAVQTASIPVRVTDISVVSRREGSDELQVQMGLSTIYLPEPRSAPEVLTGLLQ